MKRLYNIEVIRIPFAKSVYEKPIQCYTYNPGHPAELSRICRGLEREYQT